MLQKGRLNLTVSYLNMSKPLNLSLLECSVHVHVYFILNTVFVLIRPHGALASWQGWGYICHLGNYQEFHRKRDFSIGWALLNGQI